MTRRCQRAQQQAQPDAGGGGIKLVCGLERGKGVLGLFGGALFAGLLFLKALELAAALFGLPFFPALGTGALPRLPGVCRGRLRIRFTLIGPDGGTLRLGLLLRMDGRKADRVGRFCVLRLRRIRGSGRFLLRLTLCPAAELVHDLLERVFCLLLRCRRFHGRLRRLVQLCFVLRTPDWFHTVLHV